MKKKNSLKSGSRSLSPVALVTGASRGLGKQIAITLAGNGFRIAVNYLHSGKEAAEVVRRAGGRSLAVAADVGDLKQVEEMVAQIEDAFGRLDAVINNAGITRDNLLIRQTESEWDEVLATNLRGCFNVIKTAAPLMIKSGGGHIVNISSYSDRKSVV